MGISLRHMDFLSANGARAWPWQNTAISSASWLALYLLETPFNAFANRADSDQAALVRAV